MSNEWSDEMSSMKQAGLYPKLRFPDFADQGSWEFRPLGEISTLVTDRIGDQAATLLSITSGVGLVSQEEKFGREIAGAARKNYFSLGINDFAYNKSATKEFPQGQIAINSEYEQAAVPNSIFTCFRADDSVVLPSFLKFLFSRNHHGQWLQNFITVGARAHGSLQISNDDLLSTPIPLPTGPKALDEQKVISSALEALDALIEAETEKLDALKDHKQGLMKQLFPAEGETVPKLRFPRFVSSEEWVVTKLGKLFAIASGGTPSRGDPENWGGDIPWVSTSLVNFNSISSTEEAITKAGLDRSSAKVFPIGTTIMAMYGQGKTRGQVAILDIEASTNQACAAILPIPEVLDLFVFYSLAGRYLEIRELANSGGQNNLSLGIIAEITFSYPEDEEEQMAVVEALKSIDSLYGAHAERLGLLAKIKQGLLQQLFPTLDEVQG